MPRPLLLTLLGSLCIAPQVMAAEYSCDFDAPLGPAVWELHQEGGGIAKVDNGSLLLDMTAPRKGKHAWADLLRTIKLPFTLQWDQQIAADSRHYYLGGAVLRDAQGASIIMGLSGEPMNHLAHFGRTRSPASLEPGVWYHLKLEMTPGWAGKLAVTNRDGGEEVASLAARFPSLRGRLCALSFYHNQARNQGPDEYAQDRGASRFDNLRIMAPAIAKGDMSSYRDPDIRDFDPREPMTFNRATTWLGEEDGVRGAVLGYDRAAELPLTGQRQVASWQVGRLCEMRPKDATTSAFTRPNDLDGYDRVAIRSFQWCIRQHPTLEYDLQPHAGKCFLKVTMICPYLGDGIEVFRTEESAQPQRGSLDLGAIFEQRGLGYHQFQEIGIFLYQDRPSDAAAATGAADVSLKLTGPGALLTTPPIVRTADRARDGVEVFALLVGRDGRPIPGGQAAITVEADGNGASPPAPLRSGEGRTANGNGVFTAKLTGLGLGDHEVHLVGRDANGKTYRNTLTVTITDGDFALWRPDHHTYQAKSGRVLPTLLGDLYAWVTMLDPASIDRRVITSAQQWRTLTEAEQSRVRLIKLRTLNQAEIAAQLQEHYSNGIRVIRLAPNVSPNEAYLDAGGHVSMHGLETLSVVLRECRRLGIRALINLFHYPYSSPGTGRFPPWRQYIEAGYTGTGSFTTPETGVMLKQYLRELLVFLRDDPAVLGYSLTGENDQTYGAEWINDLFDHVMACDPNHIITQEQGGGIERCSGGNPWSHEAFKPAESAGLGYRTYYTGGMKSDAYMMVCARFYGLNSPVFMAEAASGPGWYGHFAKTWMHPDFITKVRDNCWASLLTRQTMCITWSAPWTQEERLIPQLCAKQIDWKGFRRKQPAVGVLVSNVNAQMIARLGQYEAALARLGVDYDYVWEGRENADPPSPVGALSGARPRTLVRAASSRDLAPRPPASYALLNARTEFTEPHLGEAVLATRPLSVTGDYSVNYLLSEDRAQMIAFVKNTAEYKLAPGYGRGVQELHRQRTRTSDLRMSLRDLPTTSAFKVFDVDERTLVTEGRCGGAVEVDLGHTCHDFAVLVLERMGPR